MCTATIILCMLILTVALRVTEGCTALAVAPGATSDACSYATTTCDCFDCDFRIALVPARQFPEGAKRPVFRLRAQYPHHVSNRARTWYRRNLEGVSSQLANWTESVPMGYVPQVRNTFALYESGSGYGLVNEHMVTIGESSCPAAILAKPISDGGKALFDVSELSQLALERSKSAREAIQIMGEHAEKYGYYGAEWYSSLNYDEAGEALTITDKDEAWIFHILADDTGASSVWAAQRVPDGHISAVTNSFIIREIQFGDNRNFMYSSNMRDVARRLKLWTPKRESDPFNFAAVFRRSRICRFSYTTLRLWRIFTLADPALAAVLNATTDSDLPGYPFSVRPAQPLSARDIIRIQRDHFEGTPYDLTKGPAAGPYGDPDRYDVAAVDGMSLEEAGSGEFGRGISLFRTSYTSIGRACAHLPREVGALTYVAQNQPGASAFIPLYVHSGVVPRPLTRGSLFRVSSDSYFWRVALVSNWAHRYYIHALPILRRAQSHVEAYDVAKMDKVAAKVLAVGGARAARNVLAAFSGGIAWKAFGTYARLFPELIARVHDGFILENPDANDINLTSFFYPKKWLQRVGYFDKLETGPDKGRKALQQGRNQKLRRVLDLGDPEKQFEETSYVLSFAFGVVIGAALCFALVYTLTDLFKVRRGYVRIRG